VEERTQAIYEWDAKYKLIFYFEIHNNVERTAIILRNDFMQKRLPQRCNGGSIYVSAKS
jgi:hypothetical protein